MDWTGERNSYAKSGRLINQGIQPTCFDGRCYYEPINYQGCKTVSTSSVTGTLTIEYETGQYTFEEDLDGFDKN